MHKALLTVFILGSFAGGCRPNSEPADSRTSDLSARLAAQEQRLAQLETETEALKAKLAAAARPLAAPARTPAATNASGAQASVNAPGFPAQVEALIAARVDASIASEVTRQIESRLGSERDIDTIFRQTVDEQMTAYEKRQEQAREETRRQQREEWEKQRAEAEKRQWDQIRTDLGLNETQTAQLKEVSQQARQTIRDTFRTLREQGTATPEQIRQQADAFKASYEASLQQVLTAEQVEAYRNQPRNLLRMIDMFASGGHFGRHFGDSTGP